MVPRFKPKETKPRSDSITLKGRVLLEPELRGGIVADQGWRVYTQGFDTEGQSDTLSQAHS